jgi:hypothetical protein
MKYFPSQDHPEIVRVEVGDAYSHNCTPPQSMPTARVYWIWKGDKQGAFDSINESHISVNEQVCNFISINFPPEMTNAVMSIYLSV